MGAWSTGWLSSTSLEDEELLGHGRPDGLLREPGVGCGRAVTDACVLWDQSFNLYPSQPFTEQKANFSLSF